MLHKYCPSASALHTEAVWVSNWLCFYIDFANRQWLSKPLAPSFRATEIEGPFKTCMNEALINSILEKLWLYPLVLKRN